MISFSERLTLIAQKIRTFFLNSRANFLSKLATSAIFENSAKLFNISDVITTKGTAKETGTGLGLLLFKEFVIKYSGKIWIESEVGKGSDFKFTLPLCDKQANSINN
jgi:light-regulated signal transduction histidine kinase (bacteriophytochrome)